MHSSSPAGCLFVWSRWHALWTAASFVIDMVLMTACPFCHQPSLSPTFETCTEQAGTSVRREIILMYGIANC